jgi:hypothetical protein
MVKIGNVEELEKIKESDYGFVIIIKNNQRTIHLSNCKNISKSNFLQENKNLSNYHWFSTHSLAQKELGDLYSCQDCKSDSF